MIDHEYDVFISAKNTSEDGHLTEDHVVGKQLYEFLCSHGLKVFFADISLERLGSSAYKKAIDEALDHTRVLVVVGSSKEHLCSRWVYYEWDTFFNDILSEINPNGEVFVYACNVEPRELPRSLRNTQCIDHEDGGFERLFRFICNSLGRPQAAGSCATPRWPEGTTREQSREVNTRAHNLVGTLDGFWGGRWRRSTGTVQHSGRLQIEQYGQRLSCSMRVSFSKNGVRTILEEVLSGTIAGSKVLLHGESFEYVAKGLSKSYLLDNFELTLSDDHQTLRGVFFSRRGQGEANFARVLSES